MGRLSRTEKGGGEEGAEREAGARKGGGGGGTFNYRHIISFFVRGCARAHV